MLRDPNVLGSISCEGGGNDWVMLTGLKNENHCQCFLVLVIFHLMPANKKNYHLNKDKHFFSKQLISYNLQTVLRNYVLIQQLIHLFLIHHDLIHRD